MENVAVFVDEILLNYYQKIHQYEENNWDIYRFGFDGTDRSKDFSIEKHLNYLKFFGTMTQKKATRYKALINRTNWILPAHQNFY